MDNNKILVGFEIADGYSFRNLIDYFKTTLIEGNFIFTPTSITLNEINGDSSLLNQMEIDVSYLESYTYNSKDECVIVGFKFSELNANTKSITKKDGIHIYITHDCTKVYTRILSGTRTTRNNEQYVKTKNVSSNEFELPKFERSESQPNKALIVSDFAKTCKAMTVIDCDFVLLKGYKNGISMSSHFQGEITGRNENFGNTSGKELSHIKIPKQIVASLVKTNNTSQNGIVKIILENDAPTRFIFPIGHYGKLKVYINSKI